MSEMEPGLDAFLPHWFAGFERGIHSLDQESQTRVLHACGVACAHSYTVPIFQQIWQRSRNLDEFLRDLSDHIAGARYERREANTLCVTYAQCGCDLVRQGWVKTGSLCECSAANLRENLEQSLEAHITVTIETSILRGGTACVLIVAIQEGMNRTHPLPSE